MQNIFSLCSFCGTAIFYLVIIMNNLVKKLIKNHSLSQTEYEQLIKNRNPEIAEILQNEAVRLRKQVYGNEVFLRGLIEISNYCKNGCYYCGINSANKECNRYRLTVDEILNCAVKGYKIGFRTIVLQGGEDNYFTDEVICDLIKKIKKNCPETAITLSLGERTKESYQKLFDAGADRYLLRHETADKAHYERLHPEKMSFENRMNCLKNLKEIGFATGCGFMVGSPYQTEENLAKDLKFIEEFQPQMCGIGPFIPQKNTVFANEEKGTAELTTYLLSIIRIIKPNILLPATTALNTIEEDGRVRGILSGANVIMPNLSPKNAREKYNLYDGKAITGEESAEEVKKLEKTMKEIGYKIVYERGDVREYRKEDENGSI